MSSLHIEYPQGATPLEADELEALIPTYITTRGELNELEHQNIQEAILWLRRKKSLNVLDSTFLFDLHRHMFNQVWRWAGCAHIFPNGNGRHARLATDLLLELNNIPPFTWGEKAKQSPLEVESVRRREYIAALRSADKNNYEPLILFVRS
jgi:fido (protein-threonine AMPylation protein)